MGAMVREGRGTPCFVPVPALPSPQQRELSQNLRRHLELVFVLPDGDPVEALDAARATCGYERIGLLGFSMYGVLCGAYAQRFPEHAAFLVTVGTPPALRDLEEAAQWAYWDANAEPERKRLLAAGRAAFDESSVLAPDQYAANAKAWAAMGWCDPHFDPSELFAGIAVDRPRQAEVVAGLTDISLPALLPALECPVLRVHGAHDFVVPPALWAGHEDLGDHVTVCTFDQSGHHPSHEEADRFDSELLKWISAHR